MSWTDFRDGCGCRTDTQTCTFDGDGRETGACVDNPDICPKVNLVNKYLENLDLVTQQYRYPKIKLRCYLV